MYEPTAYTADGHGVPTVFAGLPVLNGCATIQLSRGQNTLVDSRDYPELAGHKWHVQPSDSHRVTYYAVRKFRGDDGKTKRVSLHRAVLKMHVGPCPAGMESRHINGDSLDNRRANLAWGTHSENSKDGVRHGRWNVFRAGEPNPHTRGERNASARLKPSDIPEIRRRAAAGETWMSIGDRFGISHAAVYKILVGKSWSHIAPTPDAPLHSVDPRPPAASRAEIEDRIRAIYAEIGPTDHEPSIRDMAR